MEKTQDFKLYTYKYIWQLKDSEKLALRYITDTMAVHEAFKDKLRSEMSVTKACCEYIGEYDIRYVSIVENIKGGTVNEEISN